MITAAFVMRLTPFEWEKWAYRDRVADGSPSAGYAPVKPWQTVLRLHSAAGLMAVPKRRQTSTRRDKRRAQHKLQAPRVNECPVCHQPKRPHRVCPTCKTYRGREVEPLGTPAP